MKNQDKIEKKIEKLIRFAKKNRISIIGALKKESDNKNGCFLSSVNEAEYLTLLVSLLETYLKYLSFDVNSINKIQENLNNYFNSVKLLKEVA